MVIAVAYIQRDSGQASWPDGTRWIDKESPGETGEAVSDKVGRKSDKY